MQVQEGGAQILKVPRTSALLNYRDCGDPFPIVGLPLTIQTPWSYAYRQTRSDSCPAMAKARMPAHELWGYLQANANLRCSDGETRGGATRCIWTHGNAWSYHRGVREWF